MIKSIFIVIACLGVSIIGILAFTIPNNPYEMIPALTMFSFDKPLWFCILIGGSFIYLMALFSIYEKIEKRKIA